MKFNIEIDLEDTLYDMFENESTDIEEALKGEIIRTVIGKVLPKMQASIDEQITKRIDAILVERVTKTVDSTLDKVLAGDGLIRINRETITITKHIQNLFESHNSWNNPNGKIKEIAKEFGNELRLQYNNAFAMNIVANLKEQGLLKDDLVKILLESPQAPAANKS